MEDHLMTDERANLEAAQRDLDAKRAERRAAKDAEQAEADTKAKAEIARRMGRVREAATADPDRKRKIDAADARDEAKRAQQNAAPSVTDQERAATERPAADLADAEKRQPYPPDKARVSVVGGAARLPYAASEALRRSWRPVDEVTAVYVDGEPLAARLQDARPKNARHWLYVDDPEIAPEPDGNLALPDPSFRSVYPQNAHDLPLPMVALRMLGDVDGRKSLRSDLRTVLTVVFAATRPIDWSDVDGARLLARTKDGGFRPPESSDVRRWRQAVEVGDSIRLYYRDKHGSDYVRVMVADPYGDGRRELRPPAWFRERVSDFASVGAGMGWTLTGAAHPARQRGTTATGTSYAHVISAMEYWLSRSFEGKPGIAPMLRPSRPGSSGPWVTMRWYEALQCLAMERWDRSDPTKEQAARHRFGRLVNRLRQVGYMKHGNSGIGDVVECEESGRRRGATPWLRFRATARLCEAARLAQAGKWQSTRLLDWYGVR